MNHIKIVSVDLFQTLVDVFSRKREVWEQLLEKNFSSNLYEQGWVLLDMKISEYFTIKACQDSQFMTVREIFSNCCKQVFDTMNLDLCPERAAGILIRAHANSELFYDAIPFLEMVGEKYPICLSSDTDNSMLGSLVSTLPFDHIFTSENIAAYKLSPQGIFFSSITNYYPVSPKEIFHIGDSPADVIGAKAAGLTTCWLNRNGKCWTHTPSPDHNATSLMEIAELLK